MKNAYIIRGLPGSGKSTLAETLTGYPNAVCSADAYFVSFSGQYFFDPLKLQDAHEACRDKWFVLTFAGTPNIAVANTFSTKWEWESYKIRAEHMGYRVIVIDLFDGGGLSDVELMKRNVHGVPRETIAKMRARWEK